MVNLGALFMCMYVFAHLVLLWGGVCVKRERHIQVNYIINGHLLFFLVSSLESQSGQELGCWFSSSSYSVPRKMPRHRQT